MEDDDQFDEDLIAYAIRESLRDSSPDSLRTVSADYLRIVAAIEQADVCTLQDLSGSQAFLERDCRGWLPLHKAAVLAQELVLDQVLLASCEETLEDMTADGDTPLILAVQNGLLENVKKLLQYGASPNTTNSLDESPLLLAVRQGSYDMVSTLIIGGAFVEQVCLKKRSAIHEAAKVGCSDIIKLLLRNGAMVNAQDGHNVSPLGLAAENGHAEVLDILIQNGGDVHAQAYNGDTVLYDAAGSGDLDCIDLLLQAGANPNIASLACELPIHRAAYEGHFLALKTLIPITTDRAITLAGHSPVHTAADGGRVDCLQLLIEMGFDVNAQLATHMSESYGDLRRSPLYFAVSNNDVSCTKALLAAGAKTDLDPLPCLLVAVRAGRYEMVRLLVSWGVEVNCYFTMISDTSFPTALQYCLRDPRMLRLLLNSGYDAEKCFLCSHGKHMDQHSKEIRYSQKCCTSFCEMITLLSVVNVAGSVVRMLLDYVRNPRICPYLQQLLKKQQQWAEVSDILANPQSLQHQCRLVIRNEITPKKLNNPEFMAAVPLPPTIKHYLTYKEYDEYGDFAAISVTH